MNQTKEDTRAREEAKVQLNSIVAMVKRLEHIQEGCDGEDCGLTDAEIYEGLNLYHKEGDKATEEEREQYHDENEARQMIEEDPLSVQVRSGWANSPTEFEAGEYEILLCMGGPACHIVGDLDRNEPYHARLEYQDWSTPWIEYLNMSHEEHQILLTYARQFSFGD